VAQGEAKKVMTVLGPIAPELLGLTSMHEHILMTGRVFRQMYVEEGGGRAGEPVAEGEAVSLENIGPLRRNNMLTWDAQDLHDEEAMAGEVADFKESGGRSILDCTVPGLRCDTQGVRRISRRTGVNVVAATGAYLSCSWPPAFRGMREADFFRFMMHEIREGISDAPARAGGEAPPGEGEADGGPIYPGAVKIGLSPFTDAEEGALRAGVRAAMASGLSLTVHPCSGIGGDARAIVPILREEGMDFSRCVIAHQGGPMFPGDLKRLALCPECWALDLECAKALLDEGLNISIEFLNQSDRELCGSVNPPDWAKLAGLVELLRQGYAGQIVLGTDLCAKPMARRFGGEGYCRLTRFALPTLTGMLGVSPYAVRQMTELNPARILAY
jgi:phosphotriesterase-related protein